MLAVARLRLLALLSGRLLTADHQPPLAERVIIDWSGGRANLGTVDTVRTDSTGSFAAIARETTGSVIVTIPGAAYFGLRAAIPPTRIHEEVRLVLVPRRWTIAKGSFAGVSIAILPSAALRRAPDRVSFGRVHERRVVGWEPGSFPLAVVLRRDDGRRISPVDSIDFWSAAASVEAAIGVDSFRPAMDTALRGRAYPVDVRVDPRISGSGLTFVSWDREGNIFEASVRFHSNADMREPGIVEHELLHVLGFGHTNEWPSAMQARAPLSRRITAEEVAYAQLLMRVHELEQDPLVVGSLAAARSFVAPDD